MPPAGEKRPGAAQERSVKEVSRHEARRSAADPVSLRAPVLSVQGSEGEDGGEVPTFTSKDTAALLRSAAGVAEALKYKDYEALAGYVHPERGVTFTAYSTVNLETDQNFSADQIRELAQDDTRYLWGYEDGRGEPIRRTIAQFLEEFIFSVDYTQSTSVGRI